MLPVTILFWHIYFPVFYFLVTLVHDFEKFSCWMNALRLISLYVACHRPNMYLTNDRKQKINYHLSNKVLNYCFWLCCVRYSWLDAVVIQQEVDNIVQFSFVCWSCFSEIRSLNSLGKLYLFVLWIGEDILSHYAFCMLVLSNLNV